MMSQAVDRMLRADSQMCCSCGCKAFQLMLAGAFRFKVLSCGNLQAEAIGLMLAGAVVRCSRVMHSVSKQTDGCTAAELDVSELI